MIQGGLIAAFVWILVQGLDRLLLGDMKTGIIMGASLEAIFMGISAIGGAIPSDACAASILTVAMIILTGVDIETGLALAMPVGTILATVNELWKTVLASFSAGWRGAETTGNSCA